MANFNDLPLLVREKIYRLHLVHDEPITIDQHEILTTAGTEYSTKRMPRLLLVSSRIEQEAAGIYYGENTFDLDGTRGSHWWLFTYRTEPRHRKLFRKIICTWDEGSRLASDVFLQFSRMRSLQELTIRMNEKAMIENLLRSHKSYRFDGGHDPTPQQQLVMLRYPGVAALLSVRAPAVRFVGFSDGKGSEIGGPIPGGVLLTQVLPRMTGSNVALKNPRHKAKGFPFLSLPPELRNEIYVMVLRTEGPVELSKNPATSASKKYALSNKANESALSLLAVSHQVQDEAVGIFYNANSFTFAYSIHLHAFLQILSMPKQRLLRDITIHYADVSSGGMSMVELTFDLLKHLTGLRRLEVVLHGDLLRKIACRFSSNSRSILSANPGLIPGIKSLFNLRSIPDINVRDVNLETQLRLAEKERRYPNFSVDSFFYCVVKLTKALAHLNTALVDAQEGKVNHELLEDNQWHSEDEFPTLESV